MEKIKAFLASPEGAAAIVGFLRALFTLLIGLGVAITATQAESAIALATSLIAIMNIALSFVTVRAVQKRSDQEEANAGASGMVTVSNNATPE